MRLRDSATVLRAPLAEDPYGGTGTERDWDDLGGITQWGLASSTQPRSASEETQDRAQVVGDWQAFAYPDADVTAADRWEYRGDVYQIHSVKLWPDLRGRDHHLELDLSIIIEGA